MPLLQQVCDCMAEFGLFSRLKLNFSRCGLVVKGSLQKRDREHLEATQACEPLIGILIRHSIKYLGVRIGNITSDEAYAFPLAEAQRRASIVAGLHLSPRERIVLLKTWVLPTVLLTARA